MIKLEIPEQAFWGALGFCLASIAVSFYRFVRWQGVVMTKKEHADICEVQQKVTTSKVDQVINALKAQDTASEAWRTRFDTTMTANHKENRKDTEELKSTVGAVKTDVEVLKVRINLLQPNTTVNIQGG